MGIDLVGQFIDQQRAYSRLRGSRPGTGRPMPSSLSYPKTTWADALVAAVHFAKYADPNIADCVDLLVKHKGLSKAQALATCSLGDRSVSPLNFVHTTSYKQARSRFYETVPLRFTGYVFDESKLLEEYPHNEEFWFAARGLMIARSAAGEVQFWDDIALESVKEAASELGGALGRGLSALNPLNLVPDVTPWVEITKWATIAGGLYLFYKALEPKKGKGKKA